MWGKRKKGGEDGSDNGEEGIEERKTKKMKQEKEALRPSMIKNMEKRSAVHAKLKQQKVDKRKKVEAREAAEKRALELGEGPSPKKTPRTIENTRELDWTICKPDDDEFFAGNDAVEFNDILKQERIPKVLITTCRFDYTGTWFNFGSSFYNPQFSLLQARNI